MLTCVRTSSWRQLSLSATARSTISSPTCLPSSSVSRPSSHLHPSLHSSHPRPFSRSPDVPPPMDLKKVLDVLEQLAPLSLAEPWDNVGLLIEPSKPRPIGGILLTNDLTEAVMDEAEAVTCDLIISYHPPLFRPIKRLVQKDWKQRLAVRAVELGVAVFSPHTSWDSVGGGVNDWLVAGLGSGRVSVLSQALSSAPHRYKIEFNLRNAAELQPIADELRKEDVSLMQQSVLSSEATGLLTSVTCSEVALPPAVQTLLQHGVPAGSLSVLQTHKTPLPGHGQGRLSLLDQPLTMATAVEKIKSHLGLKHVRLALGSGRTLESLVSCVAVCAGSGADVLNGVAADLYITGEMSHHEVLDAVARGTSIILSDHSNSERGFLAVFKERLCERLPPSVTVAISQMDRDPLEVV